MQSIDKIITACENRYLSAEEEQQIHTALAEMPLRLAAVREMEANEPAATKKCASTLKKRFKRFPQFHDMAWDKTERDAALVSRLVAQAVLLGDPDHLNDKGLYWFRTVIRSFGITPEFVRVAYGTLMETYETLMSEECFALCGPYLQQVVDVLSDIPEPAEARV